MITIAIETLVYLCVGLVMMLLGYFIIDLLIPVDFPREINDGNKAVGWVSAGIYAALGFIIRSAVISNTIAEESGLLQGTVETAVYALIGIVAMILGYFLVDISRKPRVINAPEDIPEAIRGSGYLRFY